MRVGFVGLGTMGGNAARNVLRAGFELVVHDLRPDAVQRLVKRRGVENVAPDDLRGRADEGPQLVRVAGQTPQGNRLFFEQRDQPPADVAGCARHQHDGNCRTFRTPRLRWRHRPHLTPGWEAVCFAVTILPRLFYSFSNRAAGEIGDGNAVV